MGAVSQNEFEAIIFAGGDGSSLYPLTSNTAKSLLPMANSPLLFYQLNLLEKTGFTKVIVVCGKGQREEMNRLLQVDDERKIKVELFQVDDEEQVFGTLDVLRLLKDRISSDFIVLAGDVVTTASLHDLADVHRVSDASITMLLKEHTDARSKEGRKKLRGLSKGVLNYFGLVDDTKTSTTTAATTTATTKDTEDSKTEASSRQARVVLMETAALEDSIDISKPLLKLEPTIQLCTNLIDAHVYIVRRWVLDLICKEEGDEILTKKMSSFASLKNDLLPFMVNKLQFHAGSQHVKPVLDTIENVRPSLDLTKSMTSSKRENHDDDCIRVHALIIGPNTYCSRANSLYAYINMNHEIANFKPIDPSHPPPWEMKPKSKFKESLVSDTAEIDSSAKIRNSVVGSHCKIGPNAKLINAIVMDHCNIGKDTVVQNTVMSQHCILEDGCNVSDSQLGSKCKIPKLTKVNKQVLLQTDIVSN